MERNAAGDAALAPGAGRTTPWVWHWAWNAGLGVGERRSSPRVYIAGTRNLGTAMRGNERGTKGNAVRPMATSSATGPNGNCAATICVRPDVAVRPEQGESAVRLPLSSSYAAVMGKRPELDVRSNRRVQRVRSRFSRYASETEGEGSRVLGRQSESGVTSCQWDCREFRDCREKGFLDCRPGSGCHLRDSGPCGRDAAP